MVVIGLKFVLHGFLENCGHLVPCIDQPNHNINIIYIIIFQGTSYLNRVEIQTSVCQGRTAITRSPSKGQAS